MTPRPDLDDLSRFDRPGKRSRPRTKQRPRYDDAVTAVVVTVDRGRLTVRLLSDDPRVVTAVKARQLGRKGVVVGDHVRVVGDLSGDDGTLARIVEVCERSTVLRRTADDDDPYERIVVANAEQMVIVTAVADPEPRTGMIDRSLVAALDAGLDPLLCLTKTDLAPVDDLLAVYAPLGVPYVAVRRGGDLSPLRALLRDRVSVLVGHSGVGKSTLVNALVPGADRATGHVNEVTGRGRHTSTSAYALALPEGGWVVDTPGIRSFGLAHVDVHHLIDAFDDLAALTTTCPRACPHGPTPDDAPECGLDAALAEGCVDAARVESYRRLLASRRTQH